ncbi:MAG: 3-hydroxyacyl-CoA dehydrogenase/enoyl-CoA hydratase family protein [Pseudomonadota bacterium]|nr:3-hydroxyacyl-CoA dehydrogenase/enoyl-CoA hydratase family protein [Pseudomonadota bacterium]
MKDYTRQIRHAAVLGAGVMGAQIAAHLANAGLPVRLYDLAAPGEDKNAIINRALQGLSKIKPNPLASASTLAAIQLANYDQHLPLLKECDLVIEAVTERLDIKHDVYRKIAPYLTEKALLTTNTSGLSIAALAEALPAALRSRFCGTHFFNPPRYMHLLELIAHADIDPQVLEILEGFLTTTLGKGIVHANDTPGFIANRVGVFFMLAVIHHAERLELPLDLVDRLTGVGIGRPHSATFRTADVVGLDTFAHVVRYLAAVLPNDPWASCHRVPSWITALIDRGALGQKAGAGIYKKIGGEIHVLDPKTMGYRRVRSALDPRLRAILEEPEAGRKLRLLRELKHPQAEFLLAVHCDLFHFCAVNLAQTAPTARDIDVAMRWGYGWKLGPFEMWQAAGWQDVVRLIQEGIAAGRSMSAVPLPEWATEPQRAGVHDSRGSWSAAEGCMTATVNHPVYRRQPFRQQVLGEPEPAWHTVYETDAVRLWHTGDEIAVLGFKTKSHTINAAVLDGVEAVLKIAESDFNALVLWQAEPPFCAGADLRELAQASDRGAFDEIELLVQRFQQTSLALRHAVVPTVAAIQGLTLGGGFEFVLHCDRVVAALESYLGLVEIGVGLIPAGGGCKELAMRAADESKGGHLLPFLAQYFERAAKALVSESAQQAREWGYLRPADKIVLNPYEILHIAKCEAVALYESAYRPPLPRQDIPVAGAPGIATLQAQLINLLDGGFISTHDYEIAWRLAYVLCGGEVDPSTRVSEAWLLRLERRAFMELLRMEKTQQRIAHMLEVGKPLRN